MKWEWKAKSHVLRSRCKSSWVQIQTFWRNKHTKSHQILLWSGAVYQWKESSEICFSLWGFRSLNSDPQMLSKFGIAAHMLVSACPVTIHSHLISQLHPANILSDSACHIWGSIRDFVERHFWNCVHLASHVIKSSINYSRFPVHCICVLTLHFAEVTSIVMCLCSVMLTADWSWRGKIFCFISVPLQRREGEKNIELCWVLNLVRGWPEFKQTDTNTLGPCHHLLF